MSNAFCGLSLRTILCCAACPSVGKGSAVYILTRECSLKKRFIYHSKKRVEGNTFGLCKGVVDCRGGGIIRGGARAAGGELKSEEQDAQRVMNDSSLSTGVLATGIVSGLSSYERRGVACKSLTPSKANGYISP